MGDHAVGRVQDRLRGAVVLFQAYHFGFGIIPLEIQDIGDVRPPEGVNRLVRIPHHANVPVMGSQQVGEHVLGVVGVLIFIHVDILEFPPVIIEGVGYLAKQPDRLHQEVVKIHRLIGPQLVLVGFVDPRGDLFPEALRLFPHLPGRKEPVFGLADPVKITARIVLLRIQVLFFENLFDDAHLVGHIQNGEIAGIADPLPVPPQDAHAHGVEGGDPDLLRLRPHEGGDPLLHLPGRFVGEGDRQDVPGVDPLLRKQISDPVGQHPRLSASRAGHDQHRPFRGLHRFSLGRIQSGQQFPSRIRGSAHIRTPFSSRFK